MADAEISINIVGKDNLSKAITSANNTFDDFADTIAEARKKLNDYFSEMESLMLSDADTEEEIAQVHKSILEQRAAAEEALTQKIAEESEKRAKASEAAARRDLRAWETSMRSISTAYASSKRFVEDFDKALDDNNLTLKESLNLLGQVPSLLANVREGFESISKLTGLGTGTIVGIAGYATAFVAAGVALKYLMDETDKNIQKGKELNESVSQMGQTYDEYVIAIRAAAKANGQLTYSSDSMVMAQTMGTNTVRILTEAEWELENAISETSPAMTSAEQSLYAYVEAFKEARIAAQALTETERELLQTHLDSFESITTLSSHFDGIIGYAKNYDAVLGQISESEIRMAAMKDILVKGGGYFEGTWISARKASEEIQSLSSGITEAYAGLEKMANQVVLDMFKSTIAIGGISAAEMDAYFAMAADLGIISEEAATNAKQVYQDAIDTINATEIADKTGNVYLDAQSYLEQFEFIQGLMIADKHGRVMLDFYVNNYPLGGMTEDWADLNENQNNPVDPSYNPIVGLDNTSVYPGANNARGQAPINVTINTPMNFADVAWAERELAPLFRNAIQQAERGR